MKIVKQFHEILTPLDGEEILKRIEYAGRTCYASRDLTTETSARKFVESIIARNHHSLLEHINISVNFITDRGVMAELTRHRLMSYSVQSTRYCDFTKDMFGNQITVILPMEFYAAHEEYSRMQKGSCWQFPFSGDLVLYDAWHKSMQGCEDAYFYLRQHNASPQLARSVLPNSLKTEIVCTGNLREWRHILKLRTAKDAHPQIRALMYPLLRDFVAEIPVIFDGIGVEDGTAG